ncbi:conserved hypothetical protein [Candidatus Propionivibrio aalborgensis]|uniref:Uncharacterized protein n=1 Tax=Candidatus Propionivibrio aalborgensis TaxID=1860101 RepID=A0A1A8Y2G2_9RHOO|nr:hypothetical protein [Candidatus Propionivibrio aalborgensis]SBT11151.1 conserved hypothetical protein [Candidatus Propionivibrio aalborgensis]
MGRSPKITDDYLSHFIASGHGSGFDENYQSMLEIKRWNPSPVSVQVRKALPPFQRSCHFFSQSEWFVALLSAWTGAWVREQYPLWPWSHHHPEFGRNFADDASLPRSVGMLAICLEAGIRHGVFVGTGIPYIWTIDLCLTLPWIATPQRRSVLLSIKPLQADRYRHIDPLDRGPEKLEGERRYALQLGVHYTVGDASLYPSVLFAQLESMVDAAFLSPTHPLQAVLHDFLAARCDRICQESLKETLHRLQRDWALPLSHATFLLDHMLWHQMIDCDLSRPVRRSLPPVPGGRALKAALRNAFAGEGQ